MTIKTSKGWGLVAPGRPPTPSEGHAQSYARIGPEESQRLITFENGTCLSFGPDDLVNEFGSGHPFFNQVAFIDKAVRDCQSVSQRYPTNDGEDDNSAYNGFRTNQPTDPSTLSSVSLESGTYLQIPSKYASVSRVVSVYATANKSDVCGAAHPGLSADTRFGVLGRTASNTVQDLIRRESDRERDEHVRERDEVAQLEQRRQGAVVQQNGHNHQSNQAGGQQRRHQTRRGRRALRDNQSSEQQQREQSNNQGGAWMQHNRQISNHYIQNGHQEIGQRSSYQLQNGGGHASNGCNNAYQNSQRQVAPQSSFQQHMSDPFTSHHRVQNGGFQIVMARSQTPPQKRPQPQPHRQELQSSAQSQQQFSPERYGEELLSRNLVLPPLGDINFDGIPVDQIPNHIANHIMANAQRAGIHGSFEAHIPESYRNFQSLDRRTTILNEFYRQGLDQYYDSEDDYLEEYYRTFPQWNSLIQASQFQGSSAALRDENYSQRHRQTAQRGDRELAQYADELNQQPPHPAVGRLRGDTFIGEPAIRLQPPSPSAPNVLTGLAERRDLLQRRLFLQDNQQSIGSRSTPMGSQPSTLSNYQVFDPDLSGSTLSNESGGISNKSIYRGQSAGSARSRMADERRANAGMAAGGERMAQPRPMTQLNSAILAPSGPLSREPSPMPPRNRRLYGNASALSSPGAEDQIRGKGNRCPSTGKRL